VTVDSQPEFPPRCSRAGILPGEMPKTPRPSEPFWLGVVIFNRTDAPTASLGCFGQACVSCFLIQDWLATSQYEPEARQSVAAA
jgi:hypothetical protein